MCAIAGILKLDPKAAVEADRLRLMCDALRHRGPDDHGLHLDGPLGLGHRRLAIVDLAGGHQPMCNEDESVWIVFNGEIYNHAALRPQLVERGHRYRSRSDTETILHLYEEEGERCVERLQGMFAFALWDARLRRLLLARDRFGIKPLYYARDPHELVFASEIKGVLAASASRPAFDRSVLPQFLANRYVAGERTFFAGVSELRPARTLLWSADAGFQERRYWRPLVAPARTPATLPEQARELRGRLSRAVRSHLMSDVPLGLFLSGGLDSSGLLALMARELDAPVQTFAVGFEEREANELGYARLAARAAGAEHHELLVTPEQFWEALPRLVWHEDEPVAFSSSVPLYFVSRLARERVKVVLTGEGADELFFGYNRYRVTAWNARLASAWSRLAPEAARRAAAGIAAALPAPLGRYARRSFLALPAGPRALFYENFAVFPTALQRQLLAEPERLERDDPYAELIGCYQEGSGEALERMSRSDLQTYLVRLLMKQDQMSMAASIESRVPYLDHELAEHVLALPARSKLRGLTTKAVLREALRGLVPREILERGKMGFPVPVGRWLRGPFWPLVERLVLGPRSLARGLFSPEALRRLAAEHRAGVADHGERLWLLINLEVWLRLFIDGQEGAAVMRAA